MKPTSTKSGKSGERRQKSLYDRLAHVIRVIGAIAVLVPIYIILVFDRWFHRGRSQSDDE
jgi:hypothetical protein